MVKDLLAGIRQVAVLYLHIETRAKISGSGRDRKMLKFQGCMECVEKNVRARFLSRLKMTTRSDIPLALLHININIKWGDLNVGKVLKKSFLICQENNVITRFFCHTSKNTGSNNCVKLLSNGMN